jgi:hypothetical protein
MNTEVAKTETKNLPSIADYEALGLEDISYADVPKKYITRNKDTGAISVGEEQLTKGPGEWIKIVPLFQYTEWSYFAPDGMSVISKELRHEKNRNIALKDEEMVTLASANGQAVAAVRRLGRVLLVLVADREHEGPMFLSANRSNRWAMEATLINKLLENQKKKIPIFGQEFMVSTKQQINKKGQKYYVYDFKPGDVVKDASKLAAYFDLYRDLKNSQEKLLHANESDVDGDAVNL